MQKLHITFAMLGTILGASLLAGCNTPQPQQTSAANYQSLPAGVAPQNFKLPDEPGCQGDIARFQAIIDNDLATGHTTQKVRDAVASDLSRAETACKAGKGSEASAIVTSTRKKFGYPAS